jgi:hypothetical protein
MKSLSVLAITAALVATGAALVAAGASAQGISDRDTSVHDSAIAASPHTRHATQAERRTARSRASRSFASVPAARLRAERERSSSVFDGDWSVLIQTRSGNCEPTFRYGVQIQNGRILNGGADQVAVDGQVTPSGLVRVSVSAGNQEAQGAGRLSRASGGGTWRGQGAVGSCAGTWVAERRE